jgi:putative exporter of polyketide antibiotics
MHQPTPGRIEWRSPLGYRYDVTPFGTERCQPIWIDLDDEGSVA